MSKAWKFESIRLNHAGFAALRKSPEAQAAVAQMGEAIAASASAQSGEEYDYKPSPSKRRARGVVAPESAAAALDSQTNLTLLRSMDAGRG